MGLLKMVCTTIRVTAIFRHVATNGNHRPTLEAYCGVELPRGDPETGLFYPRSKGFNRFVQRLIVGY